MVKENRKKDWISPELTILVRNNPEASVFTGCHSKSGGAGSDQSEADQRCVSPPGCTADCEKAFVS